MHTLLKYLILPGEPSAFESGHLRRMNRVALAFFAFHVPFFIAVAALNHTGPIAAACLTLFVLTGPALATLKHPTSRWTSVIHGITAMCMGGLLVHFGRGPLQIEMHFYFFSLLAVVAIFGNPMVIVAAAATVTAHHLVVWWLAPTSLFNYDASLWVVAVHALFVVVESCAAVFLARSYFDNVIGLERIISARTAELHTANRSMRRIMTHVSQGLLTVDRAGNIVGEQSARVAEWLGEPPADGQFAAYLNRTDPNAAQWFDIGWQDLGDGFMPAQVILAQMPNRVEVGQTTLRMDYVPITDGPVDAFDHVLVVLTDISSEILQEQAEAQRSQMLRVLECYADDPMAFGVFFADARELVQQIAGQQYTHIQVCKRWLHTLKGNALTFGLHALGSWIHQLEERLEQENRGPSDGELQALHDEWTRIEGSLVVLSAPSDDHRLHVDPDRKAEVARAVLDRRETQEILDLLNTLGHEPAEERLQSLAQQARRMIERLGRDNIEVCVEADGVYLPPQEWAGFWSAMTHVIRNAVDHGLERAEERIVAGKSPTGRLTIAAERVGQCVEISVHDDGRGIAWNAVQAKARERGLPHETELDLHEALFADGLSTRDAPTEVSGRGVGMSAVREACHELGGTIRVESIPGLGTTWLFQMPNRSASTAAA